MTATFFTPAAHPTTHPLGRASENWLRRDREREQEASDEKASLILVLKKAHIDL